MSVRAALIAITCAAAASTACVPEEDGSVRHALDGEPELGHSPSELAFQPSYASIVTSLHDLAGRNPDRARVVEYGTSVQGRTLTALRVEDAAVAATTTAVRPVALVSEGIHGNEYLNIVDRLAGELLEGTDTSGLDEFLAKGGVLLVVPIVNPDGYTAMQRHNASWVDLNRSFPIAEVGYAGIAAPETEAIRALVAAETAAVGLPLEVSMEYHCCIGALIQPWAFKYEAPPQDVTDRAEEVADAMREELGSQLPNGSVHDILGYPLTYGGSDDYYLATYGRRAYTYEGRASVEPQYLSGHVAWWNTILRLAGTGYPFL